MTCEVAGGGAAEDTKADMDEVGVMGEVLVVLEFEA